MKDPWFFTGSLRASSITVYDTTLDWLAIGDSMGTKADNRYNSESMKTATEQKKKEEGARFVRYFGPLLDALRALGGSGTPDEVVERIALDVGLRDEVQNELCPPANLVTAIRWLGRVSTSSGRGCSIPQDGGSGASPTRSLNQAFAGTSTRSLSEMGSLFSGATSHEGKRFRTDHRAGGGRGRGNNDSHP